MARIKQTAVRHAADPSSAIMARKRPRKGLLEKVKFSPAAPEGVKKARKPHRFRPGTVARFEVRRAQKETSLLVRKSPMQRLVDSITQELKAGTRIRESARLIFHEATEAYLVNLMQKAAVVARARKAKTLRGLDFEVATTVLGDYISHADVSKYAPQQTAAAAPAAPAAAMEIELEIPKA